MICVIGGLPRSGTREFTDALNALPGVSIRSEVYPSIVHWTAKLLEASDRSFKGKHYESEYLSRRSFSGLNTIISLNKREPHPFSRDNYDNNVVGFKTPFIEKKWADLEAIFSSCHQEKVFFYCYRRLSDCYLSLRALDWIADPEAFSSSIEKSLKSVTRWHRHQPQSWKIVPVHLDSYIKATDRRGWLQKSLIDSLGDYYLDATSYENNVTNRNSTEALTGSPRQKEIGDQEYQILASRLSAVTESFNRDFAATMRV